MLVVLNRAGSLVPFASWTRRARVGCEGSMTGSTGAVDCVLELAWEVEAGAAAEEGAPGVGLPSLLPLPPKGLYTFGRGL